MSNIKRGVIDFVDQPDKKLQTVQVDGMRGELNTKVEMYQQYGLTSYPLPVDEDGKGAEVIYADLGSSTQRTIIASDDRRYRPVKTHAGDVILYTKHDTQKATHDDSTHRIALTDDGADNYRIIARTNESELILKSDKTIKLDNKQGVIEFDSKGNISQTSPNIKITGKESILIDGETNIKGKSVSVNSEENFNINAKKVLIDSNIEIVGQSVKVNGHDVVTTATPNTAQDDYNNPAPPSSSPVLGTMSTAESGAGSNDVTLNFDYTQGKLAADSFTMFVTKDGSTPTLQSEVFATMTADNRSYRAVGLPQDQSYKVAIAASRKWAGGVSSTEPVGSWDINGNSNGVRVKMRAGSELNGVLVSDITASIVNYNKSNDNNADAIATPTNSQISYVISTTGQADVTITWDWSGNNEDIDGFDILLHKGTDNSAYSIGQSTDSVYTTTADKRQRIFNGLDPTAYYTIGVQAFRAVNKNLSANRLIVSGIQQLGPFQPNANPDISAKVGGKTASEIAAVITNYNTSNDNNGSSILACTNFAMNWQTLGYGAVDITVSWDWAGDESTIDGFLILDYTGDTNAYHNFDANDNVTTTNASQRKYTWRGIDGTKHYSCSIQAYRRVNRSINAAGIILSTPVQIAPTQPILNPSISIQINGVPGSTITAAVANYNASNDQNSSAITAPANISLSSLSNTNGAVDITVAWDWTGSYKDIDGFCIYLYTATTNAAHTLDLSNDKVFWSSPLSRSYTFLGVDATKFYTIGVLAYRSVSPHISANGLILSSLSQYSSAYQPNVNPNITAQINGVSASTISAAIANYNSSNDQDGSAIAAPANVSYGGGVNNTNGSYDMNISWTWSGSAKDIDGFGVYYYAAATNAGHTIDTSADKVVWVLPESRSYTFLGIDPTKYYTIAVIAYRSVAPNISANGFIKSSFQTLAAFQPNANPQITAATSWAGVFGTGKPSDFATKNQSSSGTGVPSGGVTGDTYYNTATGVLYINVAGSWLNSADKTNLNTAAGITNQGTFATTSQITGTNATTLVASNALPDSVIGSLSAAKITAGTLAAGVIYAGTINTNQLNAGTLTAQTIDTNGYGRFNGAIGANHGTTALVANDSQTRAIGLDAYGTDTAVYGTGVGNGHGGFLSGAGSGSGVVAYSYGYGSAGHFLNWSAGNAIDCKSLYGGYAGYFDGNIYITGNISSLVDADTFGGQYPSYYATSSHSHGYCNYMSTDSGTATVSSNTFYLTSAVGGVRTRAFNGNGIVIESFSDANLKEDIQPDNLGLDFINKLSPKTYRVKSNNLVKYHGLIAQDVHALPELSNDDSLKIVHDDGVLALDYISLIAPLVNSVKTLTARVADLENQLNILKN